MPYRYVEDIATADVAFEAWGDNLETVFGAATDATINVMVRELSAIEFRERRSVVIRDSAIDMLLFALLQELIYYKDADQLLLRAPLLTIERLDGEFELKAELRGERIDPVKHELGVDVKAVTLHRFDVEPSSTGWRAFVILDV